MRKSTFGKPIFSAGEIGEYTVCPEAWRLKIVDRVKPEDRGDSKKGSNLHQAWAKDCDEAFYFAWVAKFIVLLFMTAVIIFFLLRTYRN